jgi:peptidyl-prolyl cis-trans isomerase A (cyclophilin A)
MRKLTLFTLLSIVVLAAASPCAMAQSEEPEVKAAPQTETAEANPALLDPKLATEKAPPRYKVKVETTSGDFIIEVERDRAPNGADRFYNLVKIGYYNNSAFYRVLDGFMAQVGFNGDPNVNAAWRAAVIPDDPVRLGNKRGIVTFAMSSRPNSRTTQFFVNTVNNDYLDRSGFAGFGNVIEGMNVIDSLYSGYGEGAPQGKGPSQMRIAREGNEYLKKEFPKLDYINRAYILED